MLVKCDNCGQGYDVNETRLSPQGARIKCPACSHIFLVRLKNGMPIVSSTPSLAIEKDDAAVAPVQDDEETWRIRSIGLTYTFHDLTSLRDWLNGRPSLSDVKIAKDEDDWRELGDYPNVLTTELITKFFPLGDVPTTESVAQKEAAQHAEGAGDEETLLSGTSHLPVVNEPVSTQSDLSTVINAKKNSRQIRQEQAVANEQKKQLSHTVLALIILIVIASGAAIYMLLTYRSEGGSFSKVEGVSETGIIAQAYIEPKEAHNPVVDDAAAGSDENEANAQQQNEEELIKLANEDVEARLSEARDMVKKKRWPEARATLETLVKERPENIEAAQLLAQAYRGLGLAAKAAELDATVKKLKADAKKKAEEEKKAAKDAAEE